MVLGVLEGCVAAMAQGGGAARRVSGVERRGDEGGWRMRG